MANSNRTYCDSIKQTHNARQASSEKRLVMNDPGPVFVVFAFGDATLLEVVRRGENRPTGPRGQIAFKRCDDIDFRVRRRQTADHDFQTVQQERKQRVGAGHHDVAVHCALLGVVARADCSVNHVVDAAGFGLDVQQGGVEHYLGRLKTMYTEHKFISIKQIRLVWCDLFSVQMRVLCPFFLYRHSTVLFLNCLHILCVSRNSN